jgi:protein-S-isoprenylcysteine O-methyltransferase Ste14
MAVASKDSSGVEFPPPLIYALWFGAGYLLDRWFPWPFGGDGLWRPVAGAALMAGGAVLALAAVLTFWGAGTTILPIRTTTAVVGRGPYRFTRNPMYLAMAIAYAGLALVVDSVWPLLLLPGAILTVHRFVIRAEERYLSRKFGEQYEEYRRRVRPWI